MSHLRPSGVLCASGQQPLTAGGEDSLSRSAASGEAGSPPGGTKVSGVHANTVAPSLSPQTLSSAVGRGLVASEDGPEVPVGQAEPRDGEGHCADPPREARRLPLVSGQRDDGRRRAQP
jgi:hypothetical protein